MRKIEKQMNAAVNNRTSWSNSNTRVDRMGNRSEVYLHNNHIATVYDNGDLQLSSAGWETVTTKSRLNALLENFFGYTLRIFQHDFTWYVGDRNTPFFDGFTINRWPARGGPSAPFSFTLNPLILWHVTLRRIATNRKPPCLCFFLLRKCGSMLTHVII